MKRIIFTLFLISLFPVSEVLGRQSAADNESGEEDDIQYSVVPFGGYTSDMGLLGGVLLQRFNYGTDQDRPFLSNMRFDVTATTRGNFLTEFDYEHTRSFGTDIRSRFSLAGERIQQKNYFGIGNQTNFDAELDEERYYFFENRRISVDYTARQQIWTFGEQGSVDLMVPLTFSYLDASEKAPASKFEEDRPQNRGWVNKAGIGLIADSRDSEFAPTRGFRYEGYIKVSPSFLGSDFTFSELRADFRHYIELVEGLVLAQKIQADHRLGTAPFWQLTAIGNEDGLRGYHEDRFLGESSILHLLEMRAWLFSLLDGDIRLGGQLFWDTGRVYSDFDTGRFFQNWKHTYGAGGAMSVYNSDFILRGDLGFSDESTRIYIGVGYIF